MPELTDNGWAWRATEFIYHKGGQTAVYEFADWVRDELGFEVTWDICAPCEDKTPTFDGACMVCAEPRKDTHD